MNSLAILQYLVSVPPFYIMFQNVHTYSKQLTDLLRKGDIFS